MYSFQDLCPTAEYPFCYLIGVLKKWPSKSHLSADFFTSQFGRLMTVEDQADTVWQTKRRCPLTRSYVKPTAPLTMAPSWSPFPLAASVLPSLIQHGKTEDCYASAYAVFEPKLRAGEVVSMQFGGEVRAFERVVADKDLTIENIHAHHFFWLLEMTVARAQQLRKPIIIAGLPGYGYDNHLEDEAGAETRLRLLQAGYLYPSRLPQGARFTFLSDPAAREKRRVKMAAMRASDFKLPPPPSQ
ncbi:hypothetical protein [Prosthecobacter algae]|uniref:hypothetical protein n=1 Tax=Prosthecobacter algae TaxID=1144682 RepID=UPI0031F1515D